MRQKFTSRERTGAFCVAAVALLLIVAGFMTSRCNRMDESSVMIESHEIISDTDSIMGGDESGKNRVKSRKRKSKGEKSSRAKKSKNKNHKSRREENVRSRQYLDEYIDQQ